jgi:anti-anti-sigma regulatory factor
VTLVRELHWDHDVPILRLRGSFAGKDCEIVREEATQWCAGSRHGLIINLADVDSIDPEGREALLEILAFSLKSGPGLVLVAHGDHSRAHDP